MKELQRLKPIAEQFFTLSVELLEAIDADEQEYTRFIERVKKRLQDYTVSANQRQGGHNRRY